MKLKFVSELIQIASLWFIEALEGSKITQAFQKLINRRANLKQMFSDNGTNIKEADQYLNKEIKAWNSQRFQTMSQAGIEWNHNIPKCSH